MKMNKPHNIFFILTVLSIPILPQIAIDIYLPSMPSMAIYFHTPDFMLQLSLTVYVLALGITQLIYGPFSDRFGRRPVLLTGSVLFLIGSFACVLATSVSQFLVFRILQGLGMGCGFVMCNSILADSFSGKKLATMTSFSSMVYSLSPLLAPVLGGYLQFHLGWRANFAFVSIFCFVLLLAMLFFVQETNKTPNKNAIKPKHMLNNYYAVGTNLKFMGYVVCIILAFGVMITFNIVGPFLLQNILHVSVIKTGVLLLLIGLAYLLGTFLNSQMLNFIRVDRALLFGIIIMLLSSVVFLAAGILGWRSTASVTLFTCIMIFGTGFVFPNCVAKALEVFPEKLGIAGAVIGSSCLIGVAAISALVSKTNVHSVQALGVVYLIQALLCLITYFFITKSINNLDYIYLKED